MKNPKYVNIAALTLPLLFIGCTTTNHFTTATMKGAVKTPESAEGSSGAKDAKLVFARAGEFGIHYAGNFVFVPKDSRYSIYIDAINPGWIHQGFSYSMDETTFEGRVVTDADGELRQAEESSKASKHVQGKSLWIVYDIRSKTTDDPLGFNSKRIIKSSFVKYEMRSFGLIPLDNDERNAFSLEANSAYDVKISIYEVKNVALKRILISGVRDNPGLSAMLMDAWNTVGSTFKSVVGDPAIALFKKEWGGDLAIERLALTLGAVKQFEGSFEILRSTENAKGEESNSYALVDGYKDYNDNPLPKVTVSNVEEYKTELDRLDGKPGEKLKTLNAFNSFISFKVNSVRRPEFPGSLQSRADELSREAAKIKAEGDAQSLIVSYDAKMKKYKGLVPLVEGAREAFEKVGSADNKTAWEGLKTQLATAKDQMDEAWKAMVPALETYKKAVDGSVSPEGVIDSIKSAPFL